MAKIKFSNGQTVNFDGNPTPQDIEEVASKLGIGKDASVSDNKINFPKLDMNTSGTTTMMDTPETPVPSMREIGLDTWDSVTGFAAKVGTAVVPISKDIADKVGSNFGKLGASWRNAYITGDLREKLDDPSVPDSDKVKITQQLENQAKEYADTMTYLESQNPSWTTMTADTVQSFANVGSMMFGGGWWASLGGGATMGVGKLASEEIKKVGGENDKSQSKIIGESIFDTIAGTLLNKLFTPGPNKGALARAIIKKPKVVAYLENQAKINNIEMSEMLPAFKSKIGDKTSDLIASGITKETAEKEVSQEFLSDTFKQGRKDLFETVQQKFTNFKDKTINYLHNTFYRKIDPNTLQANIEARVAEVTDTAWKTKDLKFGNVYGDTQTMVDTTPIINKLGSIIDDLGKSGEISDESAKLIKKYSELRNRLYRQGKGGEEFFMLDGKQIKNTKYTGREANQFSINDIDKALATLWKDGTGIANKFDKQILKSFQDTLQGVVKNDPQKALALKEAQEYFETVLAERGKGYLTIWKDVNGMSKGADAIDYFAKNNVTPEQVGRFYNEIGEGATLEFQQSMVNKILDMSKGVLGKDGNITLDPERMMKLITDFRANNLITAEQAASLRGYSEMAGSTFEGWLKANDRSEWADLFVSTSDKKLQALKEVDLLEKQAKDLTRLGKLNTTESSLFARDISNIESKEQLDTVLKLFSDDEKDALSKLVLDDFKTQSEGLINVDPVEGVKGMVSKLNNMSSFFGEKLFNKKQLKTIEDFSKQISTIKDIKDLSPDRVKAVLSLFLGALQAGRAYPGAAVSFNRGFKGLFLNDPLYKETLNEMIEKGVAFNSVWQKSLVGARNILRSEKLKTLIPTLPFNKTGNNKESDLNSYLKAAEKIIGGELSDEQKEQLTKQYDENQ